MVDPLSLTVEACMRAIADAGLTRDDIDGLSTYPGAVPAQRAVGGRHHRGRGGAAAAPDVDQRRHRRLPGQAGSVVAAMLAVAAGLCRHVLCFRTVWESTYAALQRQGRAPGARAAASVATCSGGCRSARCRRRTGSA